jgi:hypothetical protein
VIDPTPEAARELLRQINEWHGDSDAAVEDKWHRGWIRQARPILAAYADQSDRLARAEAECRAWRYGFDTQLIRIDRDADYGTAVSPETQGDFDRTIAAAIAANPMEDKLDA